MFSSDMLKGRVALVTGSTAGIGFRTAEQLGAAGATVILNGRSHASGEKALARLAELVPAGAFHFRPADHGDTDQVAGLFAAVDQQFGGVDIFVNMLGTDGEGPKPFSQTSRADWESTCRNTFLSLVESCRHAVQQMEAKGGGAIVSVASDAARVATPGEAVIGGQLAANVMFIKTLGLEVARHNIRCNAVTPSITTDTNTYGRMMAGGFTKKLFEKAASRARLGVASASDVASAVVFLASPLASRITSQVLSVNGGISAP